MVDRYRDHRKYRDVEKGYHGSESTFVVVNPVLDTKSSGQLPLPRLTLKRVRSNEMEGKIIDPVLEEAEVKEELVKVDRAPQERTYDVPLKKRRYVEPLEEAISVTNIPTVEAVKQALKQSVTIEKPQKTKAMYSDESDKKQQKQKQKQPKAASPQPSNEPSSSQKTHGPCQDGACAGTSASGFLLSSNEIPDHRVWLDTLKTKFDEETNRILQGTKLTERQNEILQRSFMQLCEKMSCIKMNSDRFLKMHRCLNCEFTISHQCLPLDFIRDVPIGNQLMRPVTIVKNRVVICDCGFAFFHAHLKRRRTLVEKKFDEFRPELREIDRSANVRCNKCHIKVTMSNRMSNVCRCLVKWDSMTGDNRQTFYDTVQSCLHYPAPGAPSLDEFFACGQNCCLFFHRCAEKAKVPGAKGGTSSG